MRNSRHGFRLQRESIRISISACLESQISLKTIDCTKDMNAISVTLMCA